MPHTPQSRHRECKYLRSSYPCTQWTETMCRETRASPIKSHAQRPFIDDMEAKDSMLLSDIPPSSTTDVQYVEDIEEEFDLDAPTIWSYSSSDEYASVSSTLSSSSFGSATPQKDEEKSKSFDLNAATIWSYSRSSCDDDYSGSSSMSSSSFGSHVPLYASYASHVSHKEEDKSKSFDLNGATIWTYSSSSCDDDSVYSSSSMSSSSFYVHQPHVPKPPQASLQLKSSVSAIAEYEEFAAIEFIDNEELVCARQRKRRNGFSVQYLIESSHRSDRSHRSRC